MLSQNYIFFLPSFISSIRSSSATFPSDLSVTSRSLLPCPSLGGSDRPSDRPGSIAQGCSSALRASVHLVSPIRSSRPRYRPPPFSPRSAALCFKFPRFLCQIAQATTRIGCLVMKFLIDVRFDRGLRFARRRERIDHRFLCVLPFCQN